MGKSYVLRRAEISEPLVD